MEQVALQFQSASSVYLHVALLAGITLALTAFGLWQLVRGRVRTGLIGLAAAAGAVAPAMLIDGLVRREKSRGWSPGATARVVVGAATAAVIALAVAFRDNPQAIWMTVLAFQTAVAVGMFYTAVYAYLGTRRIAILMALRCAAIAALMLMLFKPALSFTVGRGQAKPILPILLDRSASMATADQPHLPNRYSNGLQSLLANRARLEKHFDVQWCNFAAGFEQAASLDKLHALAPEGEGTDATDIAAAILRASADYPRGDMAGILLVSDGIHNASSVVSDAAAEAGVPIYVAAIGSADEAQVARRNVEIMSVEAPIETIKNNVATVTVRVKLTGLSGEGVELRLREAGRDQPADVTTLRTSRNSHVLTAKLKWTPKDDPTASTGAPASGSQVRTLLIEAPAMKREFTTEDNSSELHVLVTQPRIRVLYVEGSIRPEYKFLRRRLDSDPNVQFMAMVRMSANRFWAFGSIDGKRLTALPADEDDFSLFDVLILGDLDASFLSGKQMRLIRQFVNDGGGLLMLGGHNSFGPGGYDGSDVEAILPVLVGSRSQGQETTSLLPQLTAAGADHPIFEGLSDYMSIPRRNGPKKGVVRLPDLLGCVRVVKARPSASVLAIHPSRRNEHGPLVVLAVQRFGAGRTAALTVDTTWQWYMLMRAMGADSPYHRFWGQFVRWLANVDTKAREASASVVLRADHSRVRSGKEVSLRARVADQKGQPTRKATVSCAVINDKGVAIETLPLAPTQTDGEYELSFKPAETGTFRLKVSATDQQGATLGADELGLVVVTHTAEMDRLARDEEQLRRIADKSDGQLEDIRRLPELIDVIVSRSQTVTAAPKPRITRLYNFTLLLILLVALLTGEWLLRRNWQLH